MNEMVTFFIVLFVPIFILINFTPYWTRKTESFGVSIPEEVYLSQQLKTCENNMLLSHLCLVYLFLPSFGCPIFSFNITKILSQ